MRRRLWIFAGLVVSTLALQGCVPAATTVVADTPTIAPATQAAQVTGVAFGTPLPTTTSQATGLLQATGVPLGTGVPIRTPLLTFTQTTGEPTGTPRPTSTQAPAGPSETVTPASPQPSPTPLVLKTARIEGDTNKIDGIIFWPDTGGPATAALVCWVEAHNPSVGSSNGAGIDSIEFAITDSTGQTVYSRTVKKPSYCAFGRGNPGCTPFVFADNNNLWPGTNLPVQNGDFTLTATVNSADGSQWSGTASFSIELP
jgi:hypothetical protein